MVSCKGGVDSESRVRGYTTGLGTLWKRCTGRSDESGRRHFGQRQRERERDKIWMLWNEPVQSSFVVTQPQPRSVDSPPSSTLFVCGVLFHLCGRCCRLVDHGAVTCGGSWSSLSCPARCQSAGHRILLKGQRRART